MHLIRSEPPNLGQCGNSHPNEKLATTLTLKFFECRITCSHAHACWRHASGQGPTQPSLEPFSQMSCEVYEGNSVWSSVLAGELALGIFASYMPQVIMIARRRSTEGIDPFFLMLMNLGSSFAFTNALFLSKPLVGCCIDSIPFFDCFSGLLGPLQLFSAFLGPALIMIFAKKYHEGGHNGHDIELFTYLIAAVNLVSWTLVALIKSHHWQRRLATYYGLAGLSVGLVQYLPQLWTTYKLKHTGSLSILMMLIQVPGGYLWSLSLAMRKGSHWSTWVPVFCAASFQLTLLLMALYFTWSKKAVLAKRMAVPPPGVSLSNRSSPEIPRETTPLNS